MDIHTRALYIMNGIERPLQEGLLNTVFSTVGKGLGRAASAGGQAISGLAKGRKGLSIAKGAVASGIKSPLTGLPVQNAVKVHSSLNKLAPNIGNKMRKFGSMMSANPATTGKIALGGGGALAGGAYLRHRQKQQQQTSRRFF
jgi:hypothetical protein